MKILVVSGFLGAGKTTFIEKLVEKVNKKIAVLENEYGQVGVDGDLLKKDKMNIWEMTEGCICCSMKSDFASSVLTISNTIDPDILVVEPTGVGLLSSVIKNIQKVSYDRIKLLEPITIVDPLCVDRYIKEYKDIFTDQIVNSNQIVISKVSNLQTIFLDEIVKKVQNINPKAKIDCFDYSKYTDDDWINFTKNLIEKNDFDSSVNFQKLQIESIGFTDVTFKDLYTFESYMSAIMRGDFGDVIRAKGFLPINNAWAKFDIVNKTYTLTHIDDMKESKIILIGKNLDKEKLKILFSNNK